MIFSSVHVNNKFCRLIVSKKGLPFFGPDDKLIGFLRGSIKKPQVILIPEGVLEEVRGLVKDNPKLKIRGINE